MQHQLDKMTLETDDFVSLVSMQVHRAVDGSQLVHLTFRLDGRKVYEQGEQPERLFLTEGVTPRYLRPEGFGQE